MNRDAFEEYMEANPHFVGMFEPRCEREGDEYRYAAIQEHWLTWQRAAQVACPPALLRRAASQLQEWHAKYGKHNPEWLPPAGDVQLFEDIDAALAA